MFWEEITGLNPRRFRDEDGGFSLNLPNLFDWLLYCFLECFLGLRSILVENLVDEAIFGV
jgi:hypothetical protein